MARSEFDVSNKAYRVVITVIETNDSPYEANKKKKKLYFRTYSCCFNVVFENPCKK